MNCSSKFSNPFGSRVNGEKSTTGGSPRSGPLRIGPRGVHYEGVHGVDLVEWSPSVGPLQPTHSKSRERSRLPPRDDDLGTSVHRSPCLHHRNSTGVPLWSDGRVRSPLTSPRREDDAEDALEADPYHGVQGRGAPVSTRRVVTTLPLVRDCKGPEEEPRKPRFKLTTRNGGQAQKRS